MKWMGRPRSPGGGRFLEKSILDAYLEVAHTASATITRRSAIRERHADRNLGIARGTEIHVQARERSINDAGTIGVLRREVDFPTVKIGRLRVVGSVWRARRSGRGADDACQNQQ